MKKTVLRRSLFEKAARLLAGDVPPAWLISELEWLADGISADRWFEKKLPTRGELRNSLIAAKEATQLLIKLCESSVISSSSTAKNWGNSRPRITIV
jgi:hypothetical protein